MDFVELSKITRKQFGSKSTTHWSSGKVCSKLKSYTLLTQDSHHSTKKYRRWKIPVVVSPLHTWQEYLAVQGSWAVWWAQERGFCDQQQVCSHPRRAHLRPQPAGPPQGESKQWERKGTNLIYLKKCYLLNQHSKILLIKNLEVNITSYFIILTS